MKNVKIQKINKKENSKEKDLSGGDLKQSTPVL